MSSLHRLITLGEPRSEIQIQLPEKLFIKAPPGTTLEQFFMAASDEGWLKPSAAIMAGIVDGRLRELSYTIERDSTVSPITMHDSDGGRIYRRSLVMLMTTAIDELWPGTQVKVSYAVRDGGYYCELENRPALTADEIHELDQRMREIVAADDPISKRVVSIDAARDIFTRQNKSDKLRLLETRNRTNLTIYSLRGSDDYYFGYMLPSTGYLQTFALIHVEGAFVLQYPRRESPKTLKPLHLYEKLHAVFSQADDWLEKLEVEDIGRLNSLVNKRRIQEMILVAEALHEQQVARIATTLQERYRTGARIVLIAGPSSSGKTTFAKRLAIQLLAHGLRPFTLEMDHYFVDRDRTPRDENGDYDFESLYALDRERLDHDLQALLRGERVQLPRFNFHLGRSEPGREAQLDNGQIIILEGIHGLNPELLPDITAERIFRLYVSVMTQLNIDNHNRIPTTDVRLLRRIVRDASTRGYTASDTLMRWPSVRRGEKRNIFPYQEHADIMFNSALVYELAALRPLVEPLLLQVKPQTSPHIEANRLLSFLQWVEPLSPEQRGLIPDTSLLREFVGGSILSDYHPADGSSAGR